MGGEVREWLREICNGMWRKRVGRRNKGRE